MPTPSSTRRTRRQAALAIVLASGTALVVAPSPARAHFILQAPASWMSQDALGAPEKLGPCGDEAGGTASGAVTNYQPGQTIDVTVEEVIFHPGHYRVALGMTGPGDLPAEPAVTVGNTPCGSAAIESPAVFPVLVDDALDHTSPFAAPQTFQVTLPNVTCKNCTLQIIEFMSDHGLNVPGGCFYHHCANISIGATASDAGPDATPITDAGGLDVSPPPQEASVPADATISADAAPSSSTDAMSGPPKNSRDAEATSSGGSSSSHGCSCTTAASGSGREGGIATIFAVGAVLARRKRT